MTKLKTKPAMQLEKKTSRFWSKDETNRLVDTVESAETTSQGIKKAAKEFGVSPGAASAKYYSAKKGERTTREDRDTKKKYKFKNQPARKKAGRKKGSANNVGKHRDEVAKRLGAVGGSLTLKIKNLSLDLNKGEMYLEY